MGGTSGSEAVTLNATASPTPFAWSVMNPRVGGLLTSTTVTSNDRLAERAGLPESVTFTVKPWVPGPAVSPGVQEIRPLEFTEAPNGASLSA